MTTSSEQPQDWYDRANKAIAYYREHNRFPKAASKEQSEDLNRLGLWANSIRLLARNNRLQDKKRQYLDERLPKGWEQRVHGSSMSEFRTREYQKRWVAIAEEALAFFQENHYNPPYQVTKDNQVDPRVEFLGRWLAAQKAAYRSGAMSQERVNWFREHYPEWMEHIPTQKKRAKVPLKTPKNWFQVAQKDLPKELKQNDGIIKDRSLMYWLHIQKNRFDRLTEEQKQILDEVLPDWRNYNLHDINWQRQAQELLEFVEQESRLPTRRHDPQRLTSWLYAQRRKYRAGEMKRDRLEWLNNHVDGWQSFLSHSK